MKIFVSSLTKLDTSQMGKMFIRSIFCMKVIIGTSMLDKHLERDLRLKDNLDLASAKYSLDISGYCANSQLKI